MKKLFAAFFLFAFPAGAQSLPVSLARLAAHPENLFLAKAGGGQSGAGTPWLVGGNAFSTTPAFGTLETYDISVITNSAETAHIYGGFGLSRLAITYNSAAPAFPFVPNNEAQFEIFGNPAGNSYDQLALHGTSTTTRRAAIVFDSNCEPAQITSCAGNNNAWVQEFELGVDVAPNGGHNFFLFDEVANAVRLYINPTGQIGLGTTGVVGTVPGEVTTPRYNTRGIAPGCTVAGASPDGSCASETGSTDSAGVMIITTGSAPSRNGYLTLTFSQPFGANLPVCTVTAWDDSGTWNSHVSLKAFNRNAESMIYSWDNGSTSLQPNQTYGVMYICVGK